MWNISKNPQQTKLEEVFQMMINDCFEKDSTHTLLMNQCYQNDSNYKKEIISIINDFLCNDQNITPETLFENIKKSEDFTNIKIRLVKHMDLVCKNIKSSEDKTYENAYLNNMKYTSHKYTMKKKLKSVFQMMINDCFEEDNKHRLFIHQCYQNDSIHKQEIISIINDFLCNDQNITPETLFENIKKSEDFTNIKIRLVKHIDLVCKNIKLSKDCKNIKLSKDFMYNETFLHLMILILHKHTNGNMLREENILPYKSYIINHHNEYKRTLVYQESKNMVDKYIANLNDTTIDCQQCATEIFNNIPETVLQDAIQNIIPKIISNKIIFAKNLYNKNSNFKNKKTKKSKTTENIEYTTSPIPFQLPESNEYLPEWDNRNLHNSNINTYNSNINTIKTCQKTNACGLETIPEEKLSPISHITNAKKINNERTVLYNPMSNSSSKNNILFEKWGS